MNKIMSIDKDAENYRQGIDELLKEKQKELDQVIKEMNLQWQEEGKNIKETILEEKLIEAKKKAEKIKDEKEDQIKNINLKYESNKDKIVNEVFSKIINSL